MKFETTLLSAALGLSAGPWLSMAAPQAGISQDALVSKTHSVAIHARPQATKPKETIPQDVEDSIDLTQTFDSFPFRVQIFEPTNGPYPFGVDGPNQRAYFYVPRSPRAPVHDCLVYVGIGATGSSYGQMYLNGFAPENVSIGVQSVGTDTRIWFPVEADADGRATGFTTFLWEKEKSLNYNTSSSLQKFSPINGASDYSTTFDPVTESLVIRHRLNDAYRVAAYKAKDALAGDFSKAVYDVAIPTLKTRSPTLRGYAAVGQNFYILTGEQSSDKNSPEFSLTESEITNVDTNTGKITQGPIVTDLEKAKVFDPMPQGLGILYNETSSYRLMLGVAEGSSTSTREAFLHSSEVLL